MVQPHDTHIALAAMLAANRPLDFAGGAERLTDYLLALNAIMVSLSAVRVEASDPREEAVGINGTAWIGGAKKHPATQDKASKKSERVGDGRRNE